MNMPIRLGPTFLKNSARKKPWWSVMNWVTWGPMAVAMRASEMPGATVCVFVRSSTAVTA